eukprot:scaffold5.g619.t1
MRGPAAAATAGGPPDPDTPALTHVVAGAQICPHSAVCNPRACVADADWDRLQLVDRELELAVREEQYAAAARLRDERAALLSRLPPRKLLLCHHLAALRGDRGAGAGGARRAADARLQAAAALGELGDAAALPALFALIGESSRELADAAHRAMAAIRVANCHSHKACKLTQRGSMLVLALASQAGGDAGGNAGGAGVRGGLPPLGGARKGLRGARAGDVGGAAGLEAGRAAPPQPPAPPGAGARGGVDGAGGGPPPVEVQEAAAAALELYSDAILLDPTWAGAHVGRGCLLYRLGGYEAAVADLETAVTLDPYQWLALQMLALARGQLRRWDEARAALALAASGCPGLAAMQDFRAVEATLARWEAEAAAWRARFEAARDIAMATEGRRQLEAAMLAPPAPDWEARGSS